MTKQTEYSVDLMEGTKRIATWSYRSMRWALKRALEYDVVLGRPHLIEIKDECIIVRLPDKIHKQVFCWYRDIQPSDVELLLGILANMTTVSVIIKSKGLNHD